METQSYAKIARDYESAVKWMTSLGVKIENSRAAHYERTITYWAANFQTATNEEANNALLEFSNAILEIADFVEIYRALHRLPENQISSLIEKLNTSVAGPVSYAEETASSEAARNFMFEVLVAARCHRPDSGVNIVLDTPADCQFEFEGKDFYAECKRIGSTRKIESNAKKASAQAQRHLGSLTKQDRAIVVFDITKLFDAAGKMYRYESEGELHRFINESVGAFIEEFGNQWEKVYGRRDKRVVGTMLRFSHLAIDARTNRLDTVNNWSIRPRAGIKPSGHRLLERLAVALNA